MSEATEKARTMAGGAELDCAIAVKLHGWYWAPNRVINGRSCGPGYWAPWWGSPLEPVAGAHYFGPPSYSTELSAAFGLMKEYLNDRYFSGRERFWRALSDQFRAGDGIHQIAWPHALGYLEPIHIARAVLVAATEEEENGGLQTRRLAHRSGAPEEEAGRVRAGGEGVRAPASAGREGRDDLPDDGAGPGGGRGEVREPDVPPGSGGSGVARGG